MNINEFRDMYPETKSDLCANCTNNKCKFIFTDNTVDLPEGVECVRVPFKNEKGNVKHYMRHVYDCHAFEYKPKKESNKSVVTKKQDECLYQYYLDSLG